MKSMYFLISISVFVALNRSGISYSMDKFKPWVGTYEQKGGGGGLVIEKEGQKLWIEIWRDYRADEERRPAEARYEQVYFASIHLNTAKRLPFRGDVCPQTFTLTPEGVSLADECKPGSPVTYYFVRTK